MRFFDYTVVPVFEKSDEFYMDDIIDELAKMGYEALFFSDESPLRI